MSLLNDALRKKSGEAKTKDTGILNRSDRVSHNGYRKRFFRIAGLSVLLGSLIIGVWYLWGSISAQVNPPAAANSIREENKERASNDSDYKTNQDSQEGVKPESGVLKPKGDIAAPEKPVEIAAIKNTEPTAASRPKKKAPPPKTTTKKKLRSSKKRAPQQAPRVKDKALPSSQANRFFQKALRYHKQGKLNQAIQLYQQVLSVNPDHRDALFNLASAYIQRTAYSKALPLLKKIEIF